MFDGLTIFVKTLVALVNGFIDVWHGDVLAVRVDSALQLASLSEEEVKHAETLKNLRVKEKYLSTRMLVRLTLANYLNSEAKDIVVSRNQYGKPYIEGRHLFFNISHSGDKLAIAVSDISELGIDIEFRKTRRGMAAIAERCFSNDELAYWKHLPAELQQYHFFKFWTCKEAFVKATGRGIALGLDQCVINVKDQGNFISVPKAYGEASQWRILDIGLGGDYCGAVVIQNADRRVGLNLRALASI